MKKTHPNSVIKASARQQLLGKYPIVIFAYIISDFILSAISQLSNSTLDISRVSSIVIFVLFQFVLLLLSGIFLVGQNHLYLNIARKEAYSPRDIWYGFTHYADKILIIELIISFHILIRCLPFILLLALWLATGNMFACFFMILSGVISLIYTIAILLNYSQTLFLILEDPSATLAQLLEASTLLMHGNMLSYLKLIISFAGLYILSVLSFGLGFLWVTPYFHASRTNFYLSLLRKRAAMRNSET